MTTLTRRRLLAALTGAAGLTIAGCSSSGRTTKVASTGPKRDVTALTAFGSFGRESFFWVAKERGFFDAEGLNVTIQPGAAGDSNTKLLTAGKAQFAEVDYTGALIRAANDQSDVKILAALTQTTLIAMMSVEGRGISAPRDLAGKTLAVATGSVPKTLFPAYAQLAGFDAGSVHWLETTPQQLPALLASGKVDAIGQFVVGAPAIRAATHKEPVLLPYSKYVTDLYGNVLVATNDLIQKDPDLVKRFTRALLNGLQYAVDHPDEAGRILHSAVATQNPDVAAAEVRLLGPYVSADLNGRPVGSLETSKVVRSFAILRGVGLVNTALPPDQVVYFDAVSAAR
ncbi:MAG TPA: ABC transporter substrate-binding protein [Micromonosporaceae bacterium]